MRPKYKPGDYIRWTGADPSVIAVGKIKQVKVDNEGKPWYQVAWRIVEPILEDYLPEDHFTTARTLDTASDIRAVTHAERVLYLE
jgi:hypothetical protein